jgi:DNA-binding NtrC family response regulator
MLKNQNIFILDDDENFRSKVKAGLGGMFKVTEAASEEEFRLLWTPFKYALLLLDMRLRRDKEGLDVLREVFALDELQPVIMMSGYGSTEIAIEAVGAGAMMFLHKREFTPTLLSRMTEAVVEQGELRRQVKALRKLAWSKEPDALLGNSSVIREVATALRFASVSDEQVLVITGERGSGTSLAAQLVHRESKRQLGPFLEVNGPSIAQTEDFFNDPHSPWAQAGGGTLVLDAAESVQKWFGEKLLAQIQGNARNETAPRVVFLLQQGGNGVKVKRPLSQIPRWLGNANVRSIYLPPLRERREDIPLLGTYFLQQQRKNGLAEVRTINGAALERLELYAWPGNVRELSNAVEYAVLQANACKSDHLALEHLPPTIASTGLTRRQLTATDESWDYRLHLARTELGLADRAIRERGLAQKISLAKALGYTDRFTLMRRIRKALEDFPSLRAEYPAVTRLFEREK